MRRMRLIPCKWLAVSSLICSMSSLIAQEPPNPVESPWQNNFAQALTEQLLDRGMAELQTDDFESAEQTFSEAMQIIKINHGLDSELQIPALQLLVESLIPQGKWQSLDQQLSYFDWLNRKNGSQDIDNFLNGTEILSRLYLTAAADSDNPQSARYLIAAKNLNWRAVSVIEAVFGNDSLNLPPWLYNIVLTHFYQSSTTRRRGMTSYDYKSDTQSIVSGWSLSKNESVQKSYRIGLELLERIRTLYTESEIASAEIDAMVLVYLGDWELVFNRGNSALRYYQQAYARFIDAGLEPDRINRFFNQTTTLPTSELNVRLDSIAVRDDNETLTFIAWSPTFPGAALPSAQLLNSTLIIPGQRVLATFDLVPLRRSTTPAVNEFPNLDFLISELQLISATPDSESVKQQARREITALRLRPKLVDGAVGERRGIRLDYFFLPQDERINLSNY